MLASHLLVDEEEATEGNAFWRQHIVLLHNLALQVGHQWVCKVTNTALVAVCMHPASYCLAGAFVLNLSQNMWDIVSCVTFQCFLHAAENSSTKHSVLTEVHEGLLNASTETLLNIDCWSKRALLEVSAKPEEIYGRGPRPDFDALMSETMGIVQGCITASGMTVADEKLDKLSAPTCLDPGKVGEGRVY